MGNFFTSRFSPQNWFRRDKFKNNPFFLYDYLMEVGKKGPVLIETHTPAQIYEQIPQLQTVINRRASMESNVVIKWVDEKGKDIGTDEFYKLMENPNILQSQNEWLEQTSQQSLLYGMQYIYKNHVARSINQMPQQLWSISPANLRPVLTGKLYQQNKVKDIISHYEYFDQYGVLEKYDTEDVLLTRRTNVDSPITGVSPVKSLRYPLSNLEAAFKYRNVILTELGMLGILTNQAKDAMSGTPLTKTERERLEKEFRKRYGISEDQMKILITEANAKFQHTAFPIKDMALTEGAEDDLTQVVNFYGMNIHLFTTRNSTFENVKNGAIGTYQDTIIPAIDRRLQSLSKFLKLPKGKLVGSFEHIPILQSDRGQSINSVKALGETMKALVESKILTLQEATEMMKKELETIGSSGS
jgi:HK97 family phage portal protein